MRAKDVVAAVMDARNGVARLDMAFGIASLFRPVRKGQARQAFVIRQKWNGGELSYRGMALNDFELGVLLALLVLASRTEKKISKGNEVDGLMSGDSSFDNVANLHNVATVAVTFSELREMLGMRTDSAKTTERILDAILNLSTVVVAARSGGRQASTHLIKGTRGSMRTITVTLSYRLTRAMFGYGSFAPILTTTFNALPSGAARLIYVRLASWFAASTGERKIGMDTMADGIWGQSKINEVTRRDRRRVVRSSLVLLGEIDSDWQVKIIDEFAFVTRLPSLVPRATVFNPTHQNPVTLAVSGKEGDS